MKQYPEVIDLTKYETISDGTIAKDIADTEAEVAGLRRTMAAEEEIARSHLNPNERTLADYRATGRPYQIEERERFIAFLRRIQDARSAATAGVARKVEGGQR